MTEREMEQFSYERERETKREGSEASVKTYLSMKIVARERN